VSAFQTLSIDNWTIKQKPDCTPTLTLKTSTAVSNPVLLTYAAPVPTTHQMTTNGWQDFFTNS
jgi:hypothetical protein